MRLLHSHLLVVFAERLEAETGPGAVDRPGARLVAVVRGRGAQVARAVERAAGAALQFWQCGVRMGAQKTCSCACRAAAGAGLQLRRYHGATESRMLLLSPCPPLTRS